MVMTAVGDSATEPSWKRRLAADNEAPSSRPAILGSLIVLVLSLVWLGGVLRGAGRQVANNGGDAAVAISAAAQSLPQIVAAVLLVALAAGLMIGVRFGGSVRRLLLLGGI